MSQGKFILLSLHQSISHCGRVNSLFDEFMGVKYFQCCFPKNSISIKCEGTRSL